MNCKEKRDYYYDLSNECLNIRNKTTSRRLFNKWDRKFKKYYKKAQIMKG
ncbi:MAG: hypothetical protein KBT46_01240 [Ruminococcus sp.]|nr:hypothetical protein [Candidatus Copronaster equi]